MDFLNQMVAGSASIAIGWVCWLSNKKDERRFCQKASKKANKNYAKLQKAKKKR